MKKVVAAVVLVVLACGSLSAQANVKYHWNGFYTTLDYSYAFNLNRGADEHNIADTVGAHVISFVSGYRIRKEACVGLGVSYFSDKSGAFSQLPIFAELRSHFAFPGVRSNFARNNLMMFTVLQAGYSFPVGASSETTKIEEGGLYAAFDGGVHWAFDRRFAVAGHVGVKMLQMNKVARYQADGRPSLVDAKVMPMLSAGVSLYF